MSLRPRPFGDIGPDENSRVFTRIFDGADVRLSRPSAPLWSRLVKTRAARVRVRERTRGHCCRTLARKGFPKVPRNVPGFFHSPVSFQGLRTTHARIRFPNGRGDYSKSEISAGSGSGICAGIALEPGVSRRRGDGSAGPGAGTGARLDQRISHGG